jgi:Holliday junction resolvase RusA-like endonuclease
MISGLSVQKAKLPRMSSVLAMPSLLDQMPRHANGWDVIVTVLGEPVPWGVGHNPKTGDRFVPSRQAKARGDIMDAYTRQAPARGSLRHDEPIELELRFYIARPRYHYGSGRNATAIKPRYLSAQPLGRPDLTNLQKLAEDALTGVAWRDDDQVCAVDSRKLYTDGPPYTEIRIRFG